METVLDWAQAAGMRTGLVTTARVFNISISTPQRKKRLLWITHIQQLPCRSRTQLRQPSMPRRRTASGSATLTCRRRDPSRWRHCIVRKSHLLFWWQALDIARQLVETERGSRMEVVLGGGLDAFLPPNQTIPQISPYRPSGWGRGCKNGRTDGRDLVGEWQRRHPHGQAVHTREELMQVNVNSTEQLFGLFSHSMMPYDDEREEEGVTPR